jgi:integrase
MSVEKRAKGWLARPVVRGQRTASRLFPTKREAQEWERTEKDALENTGAPLGDGPDKTSVATAMRIFAERETLDKKGWKQELSRINKWRAAAGLPRLQRVEHGEGNGRIAELATPIRLPKTLAAFRASRLARSEAADTLRAQLARLPMSAITTHQLEDYERALADGGLKPDTIRLDMALLKRVFIVSRDSWNWRYRAFPFAKYAMPAAGKPRDQRIPPDKQDALFAELAKCRSPYILPYVLLAIETTMRRSEALFTATWRDVDLAARTIRLHTDKGGDGRRVPLSQPAVTILQQLPRVDGEQRLFPITADQLQSAWKKACARAGITGLRIHDLRHEGTTRYALRLHGNPFLLKKITGHRTIQMLERYTNIGDQDLLDAIDASAPDAPGPDDTTTQSDAASSTYEMRGDGRCAPPRVPALRLIAGGAR